MGEHTGRAPVITERTQLPEGQRHNFDLVEESRGHVSGPFGVLLNSPEVGGRVGYLGSYIRFESQLSGPQRELAILTTAREWDCAYEWAVHAPLARDAGVREAAIEAVSEQRGTEELTETEALVVRYGRAVLRDHDVPESLFRAAEDQFGVQRLTELTATIGYYSLLACVLNAFDVTPEEETD